MSLGKTSTVKSLFQSSIQISSWVVGWPLFDVVLSSASAYLGAIRGLGWSPTIDHEALCAVHFFTKREGEEYVAIDAGANVGAWSAAFSKYSSSPGKLYAFEPQPQAAAKIRERNLPNCEVLEMALGEASGKIKIYTAGETDSMASLYPRHDTLVKDREYNSTVVMMTTLDEFVRHHNISRIDFMKMDLEGAELDALKGGLYCMQAGILQALSFEFGVSNVSSRSFFRDIYALLSRNRYKVFRITPAGRLIPVQNYSEDHECFARTTTYLAKLQLNTEMNDS